LPFAVAAALAGVFQSGTGEIAEKIAAAVCSAVRAVLYRPPGVSLHSNNTNQILDSRFKIWE
jgi:stage V sporulation protein SpoVS